MFDFLFQPIDPDRIHEVGFYISWHARLMIFAWGILCPLAIIIARYFKITPNQDWPRELDNRFWWRFHWITQTIVMLLSAIALFLILEVAVQGRDMNLHRLLGYIVLIIGGVQILSALFRGTKGGPTYRNEDGSLSGDHYDMSPLRLKFEVVHKGIGYAALILIMATVFSGLWDTNAPVWMWIAIVTWWAILILWSARLQKQGRAYDTYQAIWGPDPNLPGNRIKQQGYGTVRPGDVLNTDCENPICQKEKV